MRVISIANFKGGTGKTVTACNMAAYMADAGRRVLLIDADPQHNATDFYSPSSAPGGAPSPQGEGDATLYDLLDGYADPYWGNVVQPTGREGLMLLGADMRLLSLDLASIADGGQSRVLARFTDFMAALAEADAFDYVLIDCPPSFTAASVAALMSSADVILPTRVDAFSRAGVAELIGQVRSLGKAAADTRFKVLVTMADRTNLARQGAELLRESGLSVFAAEIRDCVKVGESSYARQPLIDYAPRCTAARDYDALVWEYLREVEEDTSSGPAGHLPLKGKANEGV